MKKETKYYRYEIDENTFVLKVWYKNDPIDKPHFLEQPFNPDTGQVFSSIEDAEAFYFTRYGTEETEINPFPAEEVVE